MRGLVSVIRATGMAAVIGLLAGCTHIERPPAEPAAPTPTSTPWRCGAASPEAQGRQQAVEQGLWPAVIFAGETRPESLAMRQQALGLPGFSVAVIRNGEVDWTAAYGHRADMPASVPVPMPALDCATRFQSGSLAKPVTALAVLRLAHQGRLPLDQSLTDWLQHQGIAPGAQTADHPVTLRNLLTHTSGLTPGGYEGYVAGAPVPSLADILAGRPPANSPPVQALREPDGRLQYSGAGYTAAQWLLEQRLGRPYPDLMRELVTGPAGMRQAGFELEPQAPPALGHDVQGRPVPGGWHRHPESAAAGLWATPSDMAQLLVELWKGHHGQSAVFPPGVIQELLAKPIAGHAFGFRLMGEGRDRFLVHYGGTEGYNAGMAINLETGQGAVYMANGETGRALGHEFFMAVARSEGWAQFQPETVKRAPAPPPQVLSGLVGRYLFETSRLRVGVELGGDGRLVLVFPNGDRYALDAVDGGPLAFIHAGMAVRASFQRAPDDAWTMRLYGDVGRRQAE